jgi:hypothetical protein
MQWRKYTNLKRKLRKFPILTDICGDTIRCEERIWERESKSIRNI